VAVANVEVLVDATVGEGGGGSLEVGVKELIDGDQSSLAWLGTSASAFTLDVWSGSLIQTDGPLQDGGTYTVLCTAA